MSCFNAYFDGDYYDWKLVESSVLSFFHVVVYHPSTRLNRRNFPAAQ